MQSLDSLCRSVLQCNPISLYRLLTLHRCDDLSRICLNIRRQRRIAGVTVIAEGVCSDSSRRRTMNPTSSPPRLFPTSRVKLLWEHFLAGQFFSCRKLWLVSTNPIFLESLERKRRGQRRA